MTDRATSPTANQSRSNSARCTLTESLEQLAAASQKLADLAAKVINIDNHDVARVDDNTDGIANVERARETLLRVFDVGNIEGYDGSESMEKAREAHFHAALDMFKVMAVDSAPVADSSLSLVDDALALRIGEALLKELKDYYRTTLHGNDRVTFTTEQRTALESAFLLKPKLNTAEKRALAKTCNLNPRQVEVWVRARVVYCG
jgi:hypothetical protein